MAIVFGVHDFQLKANEGERGESFLKREPEVIERRKFGKMRERLDF